LTVDITCPPDSKNKGNLPVLVWIHGMRSGGFV
jgi:carboxylesterase type B